jgi:glycosyltransferase involved in cell wall biosynthesis
VVRPHLVIPILNHGDTISAVVRSLAPYDLPCLIVDDGSDARTGAILDRLAAELDWVSVHHEPRNRGKGAALRLGFRLAAEQGASHVIHLDADGQHDVSDVPRFVSAMRDDPEALVLGVPVFDQSVPRFRLYSRQLSRLIVWGCTLSFAIRDPLCGFRGIPLGTTLRILEDDPIGDHMEFEPGLTVRLHWQGVPIISIPTRVTYYAGGLSHFDAVRDTLRMARLYARLGLESIGRLPAAFSHTTRRPESR